MAAISRQKFAGLLDSAKLAGDLSSKLQHLQQLKDELPDADYDLLSEFIAPILQFHTDSASPIRKLITEYVQILNLNVCVF